MTPLRGAVQLSLLAVVCMLLMLAPSRDWAWRAPWFISATAVVCAYIPGFTIIMRHNPDLIAERKRFLRNPGTASFERWLVPGVVLLLPGRYLAAGLQHWHERVAMDATRAQPLQFLSTWQEWVAAVVLALMFLLQTWSMTTNRYFSSVVRIQSDRGHQVCSRGPYAWVRHPGYVAFSLQGVAEAVLLQSCWAMYCAVAKLVLLLVRTVYEDAFLQSNLPGYAAYAQAVRYRWLPLLW